MKAGAMRVVVNSLRDLTIENEGLRTKITNYLTNKQECEKDDIVRLEADKKMLQNELGEAARAYVQTRDRADKNEQEVQRLMILAEKYRQERDENGKQALSVREVLDHERAVIDSYFDGASLKTGVGRIGLDLRRRLSACRRGS